MKVTFPMIIQISIAQVLANQRGFGHTLVIVYDTEGSPLHFSDTKGIQWVDTDATVCSPIGAKGALGMKVEIR